MPLEPLPGTAAEPVVPYRRVTADPARTGRGGGDARAGVPAAGPAPELAHISGVFLKFHIGLRRRADPFAGLGPVEAPQPALLLEGRAFHRMLHGRGNHLIGERRPVGVAPRDRRVEFLLLDGRALDTAGHDLDRREQRSVAGLIREQPHRDIMPHHPERQPQVEQGSATADGELAGQRVRDQQPPVRAQEIRSRPPGHAGAQLHPVVSTDPEHPGLRVVDGWRHLGDADHLEQAVIVGEWFQHDAPQLACTGTRHRGTSLYFPLICGPR